MLGGELEVTIPQGFAREKITPFLEEKKQWIVTRKLKLDTFQNDDLSANNKEHFLKWKDEAQHFCEVKVDQWNKKKNFDYKTIRVKQMKTKRWSCSTKKNLNYNYKILFLPEAMADYVIVHELCHLQEMNHSENFWQLVGEVFWPSYQAYKEMR